MRKSKFTIAAVLAMAAMLPLESCIGSFALTKKVLTWNHKVGNKAVNELVFVAFWILPVYEITAITDLLVINSIEFWSGENPVVKRSQVVEGNHARYKVDCDEKGYVITNLDDNTVVRFNFDALQRSWSVESDGNEVTFLTFVDDNHVRMISPTGGYTTVDVSEQGIMAYRAMVEQSLALAQR